MTLEDVAQDRIDIYRKVLLTGYPIPILVYPIYVVDRVLDEAGVEWYVSRVWENRAGGPPRMRDKQLKHWMAQAREEKDLDNSR